MPSRGRRLAPHRKAHDLVSHVGDLDGSERNRIARATPKDDAKEIRSVHLARIVTYCQRSAVAGLVGDAIIIEPGCVREGDDEVDEAER